MGSMLDEKYFPCTMELEQMEKNDPEMFEIYLELMSLLHLHGHP